MHFHIFFTDAALSISFRSAPIIKNKLSLKRIRFSYSLSFYFFLINVLNVFFVVVRSVETWNVHHNFTFYFVL